MLYKMGIREKKVLMEELEIQNFIFEKVLIKLSQIEHVHESTN